MRIRAFYALSFLCYILCNMVCVGREILNTCGKEICFFQFINVWVKCANAFCALFLDSVYFLQHHMVVISRSYLAYKWGNPLYR